MYLRTARRRNKDGSIARCYALAENVRHPEKGHVEAKVVHSFGRTDRLDRAALERPVRSIRRVLEADARRCDRGGGVLAQRRSVQARRRPGLLRRHHRLVRV